MKKKIVFCLICLLSFNLFANISWELGGKGRLTCSYTNISTQPDNTQLLDFSCLGGADITLCFSRFIGLNVTMGPTYGLMFIDFSENTPDVSFTQLIASACDFSLVLMIPFTPKFKLRTEQGWCSYAYSKGSGDNHNTSIDNSYCGYAGSLGFVLTPIKHLCIGFGADYNFCNFTAEENYKNSEYRITYPGYNVMVCPYVTVAARLGKNLK